MGKLIDQDYLWIQERPQRHPHLKRYLPLALIPLTAAAAWVLFTPEAGNTNRPRADHRVDARLDATASIPTPAARNSGRHSARAYAAVARGQTFGQARLIPVSRILTTSPAADLNTQIDGLKHPPRTGHLSASAPRPGWRTVHVRAGDTLSIAFNRNGLSYMDSLKIAHLPTYGAQFTRGLKGGDSFRVKADADGHVQALDLPLDKLHTLAVRRDGDGFTAHKMLVDVTHHRAYATGVIASSFYHDALASGLNDRQVLALNHIFSWDIDFGQDLRAGDRFAVVYDELYRHGRKIGNGGILAAAFVNQGKEYRALRYTDAHGNSRYYTPTGRPMKQAFVRAPVDYTRISSPFSMHRMNPILHIIRPHDGTDYAAPKGTPIHATGSGRIVFEGRRGGYGNMVIIRHNADITMRFGHMSAFSHHFGLGSHVKQGDVIGYVGMTGLATGPHVHYEFRVDGVARNPQTVKLPGEPPLTGSQLASFRRHAAPLVARIDDLSHTSIASVEPAASHANAN